MAARALDVYVNQAQIGVLSEENSLWRFDYAPAWQAAAAAAFDLAPALQRSQLSHVDGASLRPVQWYFDNLLPEEALRVAIAKEAKIDAQDAFGLLAHFGAESAGSLMLQMPGQLTEVAHGLQALHAAELERRILALPIQTMTREAPKRMSMAGAQHKLLAVLQQGKGYEPLAGTPSTWILKPDHPSPVSYPVLQTH